MIRPAALAACLVLAGCASPLSSRVAAVSGDAPFAQVSDRAALSSPAVAFDAPHRGVLEPDEAKNVAPVEPMTTPPGTICTVHGTGSPFRDSCSDVMLSVTSDRAGASRLARFLPRDIDVTWAFSAQPGRVWVGVREGGFVLRGFTPNEELFSLRQEVEAEPGHLWFAGGAPVRVDGARDGAGAIVHVDGDLAGVEGIKRPVGCDALAYESGNATPTRASVRLPPDTPRRTMVPRGASLAVLFEPGGRPVTTLTASNSPLQLSLEVVQELGPWKRVEFDTTHAHFDVWVESAQVDESGGMGFGTGGFGLCGGSRDGGYGDSASVEVDTQVIVSANPRIPGAKGLVVEKGAGVRVVSTRDGFVEIASFGSIAPPAGLSFWVPSSALGR